MRHYGMNSLKKLLAFRHQQWQVAEEHEGLRVKQRSFNVWYETIRRDIEINTARALDFHNKLLYRRYFVSWQRYKQQTEIAEERAERHYVDRLMTKAFKQWQDYTQSEVIRLWRLEDVAKEHSTKRLLKGAFVLWRHYPDERRKEREREKRLLEMRMKVKDLVPDYRGVQKSSDAISESEKLT